MTEKSEKNLQNFCAVCGSPKAKTWDELTDDEKFIIERLPAVQALSQEEKTRRRYCARCLNQRPAAASEEA
jgi:hypothetical protein